MLSRLLILSGLVVALAGAALAQVDIGFGGVAHDASQPVEVTSDTFRVSQAEGQAVFSGNVIVVQGDLRMAAGEVQVVYADIEGRREVTEVSASGGVLVTRGEDAAEGAEARYAVQTAMLTLTGDVLVTQGPTAIAGDRMVVNMATGDGTLDGRVRTVLDTGGDE